MLRPDDTHKSFLESYGRPVVHMRNQVSANRFGLVFGSGLSKGLGIPTWRDLVKDLSQDP